MSYLVELEAASKIFQDSDSKIAALDGVTFNLNAGESVAVVGPSGSGKSTLLASIALMSKLTRGVISLRGEVVPENEAARAKLRNVVIGYVHQEFSVIDDESALANVAIPLEYSRPKVPRSEISRRSSEALAAVGLTDFQRQAGRFSGGQRQRIAIARAMVNKPSIIIADEPTASLDSQTASHVIDLLMQFKSNDSGVIISTHDLAVAKKCDRIVTMNDGRIVG